MVRCVRPMARTGRLDLLFFSGGSALEDIEQAPWLESVELFVEGRFGSSPLDLIKSSFLVHFPSLQGDAMHLPLPLLLLP